MANPYWNDPAYGWNTPDNTAASLPGAFPDPTQTGGILSGRSAGGPLSGAGGGFLSGLRGLLDPQYALPMAAQLIGGATPQASFAGALSAAGPAIGDMRQKAAINAWLKSRSTGQPLSPEAQQMIASDPALAQKLAVHDLGLTAAGDLTTDQRNFANAQKDPAFNAFLNRQKPGSEALEVRRWTLSANAAVRPYMEHPVYKLASMAAPMMSRIEQASIIPGSVADQELLDTVTKLNTAGGQVTEAQVNLVLKGKSLADEVAVWQNYLTSHGGVLSDDQRKQLLEVAHAVNRGYQKLYKPVREDAIKAMKDRGIPEDYWGAMPDLTDLSVRGGIDPVTGAEVGGTPGPGAAAGAPAAAPVAGAPAAGAAPIPAAELFK